MSSAVAKAVTAETPGTTLDLHGGMEPFERPTEVAERRVDVRIAERDERRVSLECRWRDLRSGRLPRPTELVPITRHRELEAGLHELADVLERDAARQPSGRRDGLDLLQ
jgi:hypothetical protein